MKDHPDRKGRLQLIEAMFAGHSWQEAIAQSQLHISRSTAYRLRQLERADDKAELAFLDDRHGHPYKLIEPARTWLAEFCTSNPQVASSRVQAELKTTFGVSVSVSQINRVRAKLEISTQRRGQIQGKLKKLNEPQLYRNDVGGVDRPRAGLQSALHGTISRPPGPCWSRRTPDRGSGPVDLGSRAARASIR